jgi:pimeloyl-ACP methyl ester carboxylesterase
MSNDPQPDHSAQIAIVQDYRPIEALVPTHWTQGKVLANGIHHYYYRTGGNKPPIVCLHGFLEGALTWLRTACALEEEYDVLMIDARGHGRSDGISAGYADMLLADAVAVIRALYTGPVRVLGHSQGGNTAQFLVAAYPYLVQSLIVEGASDSNEPLNADFANSPGYQTWLNSYVAWLETVRTQAHAERMVSGLSQLPPGMPIPAEEDYVAWIDACACVDLDLVRLGMTLWERSGDAAVELEQAQGRITCPTLIMKSGMFSKPDEPQFIQEEPSERPNVKVIRFVNTGHLIHRDQFDSFIHAVRVFFARH